MGAISPSPSSAPCDSAEQVKSHFQRHLLLPQPGLGSHRFTKGVTEGCGCRASQRAPTGHTAQPPAQRRAEERLRQAPGSPPHRIQPRQFPSSRNVTLQGPSVMTQRFEWKQRL